MKVYIKEGYWEDALRIELHISCLPKNRICEVDEKYRHRVEQIQKEGLVKIQ